MNKELAVWVSAIAGVALVVLYLSSSRESSGGANPVFQVSGISAEVAAIRSSERIAAIDAKRDTVLGWLSYQLGLRQSDNALALGTIESNNELEGVRIGGEVAREGFMSEQAIARMQADAQRYIAQQNNKTQRNKNTWSGIGSLVGSVLKFL